MGNFSKSEKNSSMHKNYTNQYSYSKLTCFEQCPFKYRLKYIERIKPPIEQTIENCLGKTVHSSLEWLYKEIKKGKVPSAEDLVRAYASNWRKIYSSGALITNERMTKEDYFNRGVGFLLDYYLANYPFDDNTLDVEKKIGFELEGRYILGFIDRLAYDKTKGEYVVHDYKTSGTLPTKERIEKDKQLSIYTLAIKELFGKTKRVLLVWHYLHFNKKIFMRKSDKDLEKVKRELLDLILKIESESSFRPTPSGLCEWCEYKKYCPVFGGSPPMLMGEKRSSSNPSKSPASSDEQDPLKRFPTIKKYLRG